ncbi:trypsin-like [Platysternon megacephalum]|uniref:Nuclear pore complex protein Nup98-Nup96 n=1 Tax=Platysternon megacephalum TaxID=55544 RepID=A0A4D9DLN0_9SAUR|nr:trypsin-like [Platysternon megacephalum]
MFNKSFGTPFGGSAGGFGTTSTFGQNAGFGTTSGGAFGTSAFGSNNNTGSLFGNTQTKPGGLFGSSTFSQPATSSTSTGFGFGTSTGTSNSLFGTASTGGGLFSSQNNAFAQNKPAGFGNFGTSTSSGGLFGTTNTASNPFGGTSGSLFGPTSFTAAPTGTTIKFNPPTGTDTMVKSGVSTNISTKHQCITAMKEYESKSLESPEVEQLGRVVELDSDMADITQEPAQDSILEDSITEEPELVPASTHIASSLGINPHVLQIMKASLLADEEDVDLILDHHFGKQPTKMDTSQEICSPRLPISALQGQKRHSSVGGLLQSKFASVSFLQSASLQDFHGPRTSSLGNPPSAASWSGLSPLPSAFSMPSAAPEVQLKTVGACRQQGLIPLEKSVTYGKGKLLMDMALFMGRSFRVGWGPNWTLVNSGDKLSGSSEPEDLRNDSMEYGFLPTPVAPKSLSESPFKVHIEKLTLERRKTDGDQQLYLIPLQIKLKHSTVHVDERCPLLAANPGVSAIHDYADWVRDFCGDSAEIEPVVKYWCLTWMLCEAIWGHLKELEASLEEPSEYIVTLERRKAFSRWLSQTAAARIEEEVSLSQHENHIEAVFSYLTGKRISEACRVAQQSGDHRLALLLSQLVGSQQVRELLTMQLVDWHGLQADCFIQEERLRIFALLAGKPVWQLSERKSINVCSQLDWKRSVAIHLWYLLPPTASISKALNMYEAAFQNTPECEKYACCPLPPYLEDSGCVLEEDDSTKRPLRDVCFHLLKLYSDRPLMWTLTAVPTFSGKQPSDHSLRLSSSDAIINENYNYLKGFLEDLSPPERSTLIQDWDTAGLVYLDYIRVIEMLDRIQQLDCSAYELERLHTKVTSLCNRIEQIQCHNAKDRLAQSDMAKRVANLLRVVLSLQHSPEPASDSTPDVQRVPLRLLAPHIGRLPMPEDYALEELRSLTQSYLRELTVVTHALTLRLLRILESFSKRANFAVNLVIPVYLYACNAIANYFGIVLRASSSHLETCHDLNLCRHLGRRIGAGSSGGQPPE